MPDGTELPESIGQRLRRIREARGFTQSSLAQAAGIHRCIVNRVESGERAGETMFLGNAMRLAYALGISLDGLAGMPDMRHEGRR